MPAALEELRAAVAEYRARAEALLALRWELTPFQNAIRRVPAKRKAVRTSRRAGKTHLCVSSLVESALMHPGTNQLYIATSRHAAKKLTWQPLKSLFARFGIDARCSEVELTAALPNGSEIWLTGAPNDAVIERLRGPKYKRVIIDECASYNPALFDYLIDEVLEPALLDLDGDLLLTGTPGTLLAGTFYEVTNDKAIQLAQTQGYSVHVGTMLDNPKHPRWAGRPNWETVARSVLEAERVRKGLSETDPRYLREYMGQWVTDDSKNPYIIPDDAYAEPDPDLAYVLGIDLGFVDDSAYVVLGYKAGVVYEVLSISRPRMTYDEIVAFADRIVGAYQPECVVVDPGAGGKNLVAQLQTRYKFPCRTAQREKKGSFMRVWGSEICAGRMKFLPDSKLAAQLKTITWNKHFLREADGIPCDTHDAGLYAFRQCYHWLAEYMAHAVPRECLAATAEKAMLAADDAFFVDGSASPW